MSKLCNECQEAVYITQNGYGDMVIMSMKAYEEKLELLDVYDKLDQAEEQLRSGVTADARSELKRLRAKYGI